MTMPRIALAFFCLVSAARGAETPAKYFFTYTAKVQASAGKQLRVWLPFPVADDWQKVSSEKLETALPHRRTQGKRFGNAFWFAEGKPGAEPVELRATYEVTRLPQSADRHHAAGTPDDPAGYLHPDRKVVFADKIRAIARAESRGKSTDDAKMRAFYDYVVRTMAYDKSGTGWGQGDAVWACDNKRGNCTDFHSLFIALNRIAGVPARFFIGVPIPEGPVGSSGAIAGYHCWAEAYSSKAGWVPVDASEAKKSGRVEAYFGHLPPDRIAFSAGRDLRLEPPQAGEPLNFFVYPYAKIDGKPVPKEAIQTTFHFERRG